MAYNEWFQSDLKCREYTNPIARWMGNCPNEIIQPVYVTPAAPRSIAELTSGRWTPEEAFRLTQEKYTAEKQRQRDLYAAGGNPGNVDNAPLVESTDWILIGGMFIAGLVVIKAIKG